MKLSLLFSLVLAFLATAAAAAPVGMQRQQHTSAGRTVLDPPVVSYACNIDVEKFDSGWKRIVNQDFQGVSNASTNYTVVPVSFDGVDYSLSFVYDPMGSGGYIGDDSAQEMVWFNMGAKGDTSYPPLSRGSFSGREGMEVPLQFAIRDDFKTAQGQYILRIACQTHKTGS
jgi:hypothetical protein